METVVRKPLKEVVKVGFVKEIKNGYQFTHDKIPTAFQEMIGGDEEVKLIHKVVGETILALGDGDDATMYRAIVHLNVATSDDAARTDGELHRLAQNNLCAAKHCISKSAFVAARDLLQFGIGLIPWAQQRWTDPFYGVTSQLTELLAKTELVIGNFGKYKEATSEALCHTRTTEMKLKVLYL